MVCLQGCGRNIDGALGVPSRLSDVGYVSGINSLWERLFSIRYLRFFGFEANPSLGLAFCGQKLFDRLKHNPELAVILGFHALDFSSQVFVG